MPVTIIEVWGLRNRKSYQNVHYKSWDSFENGTTLQNINISLNIILTMTYEE